MKPRNIKITWLEWIFDILDWYKYLIISRSHLLLGHSLGKISHCEQSDCTFDLVICQTCKKTIGWLDKEESYF